MRKPAKSGKNMDIMGFVHIFPVSTTLNCAIDRSSKTGMGKSPGRLIKKSALSGN